MVSTGVPALDRLLSGGYPERSAILIEGPSSNEKERLAYHFIQAGLDVGDFCLFVTRLTPSDVMIDAKALGVDLNRGTFWMCPEKGDRSFVPGDLASVSFGIKSILKEQGDRRARVLFDLTSQLLMSNSTESVYRFTEQLLTDLRKYDASVLATVQEDMHQSQVIASLELLFDGVLGVRRIADNAEVKVKKMRGIKPTSSSALLELGSASKGETGTQRSKERIAVLPFVNMSPDPSDEYFADGMTEELIDRLAQVKDLKVIARTSIMSYKMKEKKASEIAKELDVGTLIEGSIRKAGNKVRVTIQLINSQNEEHLWSSHYDRELDDIFDVQSEIATGVAEALRVKILSPEMKRIEKKPTESMAAYTTYLKGRSLFYNRMQKNYIEFLRSAAERFEEAIKEDPDFSLGYVGEADCRLILARFSGIDFEANVAKAKTDVAVALDLDPTLAEAHVSYAQVLQLEHKTQEAEEEYRKAISLKPSYADGHHFYSVLLISRERWQEALKEIEKAEELDPLSNSIAYTHGRICSGMKDFVRAIQLLKRAAELGNIFANRDLGEAYGRMKRYDDMRREMATYVELIQGRYPSVRLAADAEIACLEDDKQTVRKLLPELEAHLQETGRTPAYWVAGYYFFLGDNDKGFEWLEKSYSRRDFELDFIKSNPNLDGVRTDVRYLDIVTRLGLERGP